jgi:hypothetical protein
MNDVSYFGIRGLGSNVAEWVAEAYDPDAGLAEFVQGTFRKPSGPLRVALGDTQGMHVVKSVSVGARAAGDGPDPSRGFRCAADLAATEQALEVPAAAPKVLLVLGDGLQVFSGVAEVVSRSEAEAFCRALVVPSERGTLGDWRLPTLAEIDEVSDVFRGPGPFWTVEGAAAQSKPPGRGAEPGPWGTVSSTKSDVWAARCVRGG